MENRFLFVSAFGIFQLPNVFKHLKYNYEKWKNKHSRIVIPLFCLSNKKLNEERNEKNTFPIEIFPRRIRAPVCSTFILFMFFFVLVKCGFFHFHSFPNHIYFECGFRLEWKNASMRRVWSMECGDGKAESDLWLLFFILRIAPILLNDERCACNGISNKTFDCLSAFFFSEEAKKCSSAHYPEWGMKVSKQQCSSQNMFHMLYVEWVYCNSGY